MSTLRPSSTARAALIAVVLLALVAVQWLGTVHRVVHSKPMAAALQAAAAADGPGFKSPASTAGSFFQSLFAGHDQDGSCDIYDQLSHADVLWSVPVLAAVVQVPDEPVEVHRSWHLAAQSAGFLARGPPALS